MLKAYSKNQISRKDCFLKPLLIRSILFFWGYFSFFSFFLVSMILHIQNSSQGIFSIHWFLRTDHQEPIRILSLSFPALSSELSYIFLRKLPCLFRKA